MKKNLLLLIILFLNLYKKIKGEEDNEFKSSYPNSLLLSNGKIFIANSKGFFICDYDLTKGEKYYPYENIEINFNSIKTVSTQTEIIQFPGENGIIICLVKNAIYFFGYDANYLFMDFLPEMDYTDSFFNLIDYQSSGDFFFYIISFIIKKKIYILYYKVNAANKENYLIFNTTFTPFYFDYPGIEIFNKDLGCKIMNSESKGKVLTCCFQTGRGFFIVIQSFIIENNFEPIGEDVYAKIPSENSDIITSAVSDDGKHLITFYRDPQFHGHYFIFNIDANTIIKKEPIINRCFFNQNKFKLYYIKEAQEYIFLCSEESNEISVVRMRKDFTIVNKDSYTSPNFDTQKKYNILNLIYDKNSGSYLVIIDADSGTDKFLINTDFNNCFSGGELPTPFPEEPPINETFSIDSSNKYYLKMIRKDFKSSITVNDIDGKIIDFFDENDPTFIRVDNGTINKSLYAIEIYSAPAGKLKYILENGEERDYVEKDKIFGVFKFKYIPQENSFGKTDGFSFQFFLRNFSLVSTHMEYTLLICAYNCSCIDNTYNCLSCATNYSFLNYFPNCISNLDLQYGAFYDKEKNYYYSCHEKCKTCGSPFKQYNDLMNCTTCYEEREEYLNGTICYEKKCDYLFYKDKDIKIKTCINETSCPADYPILDNKTHECKLNITEDFKIPFSDMKLISIIFDILSGSKNINSKEFDKINRTFTILSNLMTHKNISYFKDDILFKGNDTIFQLTTTENQKRANPNSETSIIHLGECEKIIKRNISYEDDPIPLIILKIDIKKSGIKTKAVEYEVYNPYTRQKIDLDICSNEKITVFYPVELTDEETSLYENLKGQGYELFDANDSFYQEFCTQYTSRNNTDVILIDRRNYFYNENVILCENICKYGGVNTKTKKVYCQCNVKTNVDFDANYFNTEKFLEGFYQIENYTNYQVLFCYKLVFSKKGIKNNICFYILLAIFLLFVSSMVTNIFLAMKKINEIIFKIFQDKYMFDYLKKIIMNKRTKGNTTCLNSKKTNENNLSLFVNKKNIKDDTDIYDIEQKNKKLNWIERLKKKKSSEIISPKKENLSKFNNSNKKINNSNKKNSNNENKNSKNLMNLFSKSPVNKKNIKSKDYINYFNNSPDKKYFNNNIQVINNYNFYNCEKKKENDSIINEDNNKDEDSNKQNCLIKKSSKKFMKETYLISDKSDNSNPPLKKKKEYSDEKENIECENKSTVRKIYKRKNTSIIKRKNSKKNNFNETPKALITFNQSIKISKNEDNSEINKISKKISQNIINDNVNKKFKRGKRRNKTLKKNNNNANNNKNTKYIDEELNRMDYEEAIIFDKRNYWQYYYSLLKKKHLIILTFIANNDYNVFILKFSLFIISLTLFFALNTLFFRDSTMQQIFIDQGKFRLIYQIPQILYSTLISSFMTFILKQLSLSQNELIKIKKEPDKEKSKKIAAQSKKNLKIKLWFFFIVALLLIIFCWYYITAFGAVYPNTQIYLIEDTCMSFMFSMIYPFAYNLIPGLFRMASLKAKKKDKKWMYDFSGILSKL